MIDEEKLLDEFCGACFDHSIEDIRRLAPYFDLNKTRFMHIVGKPSPLVASLMGVPAFHGQEEGVETLLELGAIPSPRDAMGITTQLARDIPYKFYDFFSTRGHNIRSLLRIYYDERMFEDEEDDDYDFEEYDDFYEDISGLEGEVNRLGEG